MIKTVTQLAFSFLTQFAVFTFLLIQYFFFGYIYVCVFMGSAVSQTLKSLLFVLFSWSKKSLDVGPMLLSGVIDCLIQL